MTSIVARAYEMGDVASITLGLRTTAVLMYAAGLPGEAATFLAAFEAHCRRFGVGPRSMSRTGAREHARGASGVIEFLAGEAFPRFCACRRAGRSAPAF